MSDLSDRICADVFVLRLFEVLLGFMRVTDTIINKCGPVITI